MKARFRHGPGLLLISALALASIERSIAAERWIDEAKPPLVSMVTYKAGLPPEALNKYYEICAIFAAKGYRAGKSDVWHGQHTWMMERQVEQSPS